eukprot:TRINITY_DN81159_c0_g1_i1.p1 TRINITY_DN81159_c0_g1~~TRINITY_DN81159_c0_g1_i1.p1  ORF type:complete len:242 (+),score=54.62 TRINITY_DN81159_c0_g1_i1:36-761(+)
MPPFWASSLKKDAAAESDDEVLLREYAEDPDANRRPFGGGSLFAAGASSKRPTPPKEVRGKLPAQIVKTDPRKERQWNNRHIGDKREGARNRAEELRAQILRGSQAETVKRGTDAFQTRSGMSYEDIDDLQPEGSKLKVSGPANSSQASSASSTARRDYERDFPRAVEQDRRVRLPSESSESTNAKMRRARKCRPQQRPGSRRGATSEFVRAPGPEKKRKIDSEGGSEKKGKNEEVEVDFF